MHINKTPAKGIAKTVRFRPPEQSSVASTGAQPLIAGDWDLQLEEGEQVQCGPSPRTGRQDW